MDGLIHTAVEAEDILKGTKHVNVGLTHFDRGVVDHKMTWNHDKMLVSDMVEDSRTKFRRNSSSSSVNKPSGKFDLFKKLHELYEDLSNEDSQNTNYQSLRTTSHLLEKLLTSYNLNTLIINLYPGNKGYSLSLKVNGNTQQLSPDGMVSDDNLIETPRWPYEEEELLSYIDNEELPLVLLDLLESEHSCLFYSGCIIAQIRDYRQAYPSFVCDTHHVLLRPTTQSILTDAMSISSKCGWTGDDRTAFEAALVLATAPPLCLDPNPSVGLLAARLHSAPRLFNTPMIRRQAKRFSQVAVNRKRKLDQFTHHHGLELVDLIHRHRAKNNKQSTPQSRLSSKYPKRPPETFRPVETLKIDTPPLAAPIESVTPLKIARAYDRPRISQDCSPQLIEEYILETEKHSAHGGSGFFHIKLTILQRPSDQEFLGELYVDRDHIDGEKNGAACRFILGNRIHANKYIQQFTEIFTEEGRKHVRITHLVPGQVPRVSFTAGLKDLNQTALLQRSSNSTVFSLNPPSHSNLALPTTTVSVASRAVKVVTTVKSGVNTATVSSDTHVKPSQPSPKAVTATRTTSQVHDIHSSQPTNQLLTQQLANPQQPLNPQKMQSAIIHIQHPIMSTAGTSQVQSVQYSTATTIAQQKATIASKPRSTNAAISALVTSLMNSAQQFQQAKAAVSTPSNNSTILNLLNSAPAAMTHPPSNPVESTSPALESPGQQIPITGRTVSIAGRIITNVTTTTTSAGYTHQVMNYKTENDNTRVTYSDGGLLERLIAANSIDTTDTSSETQPSLPTAQPLQLQGVSLASLQGLQGIQGVQNVQVQIPGMAQPISLQLNVSAPSGLLVSMPPTTSVMLNNQSSVLSLPIAQLMSSGVNQVRGGMQIMRGRSPVPRPARTSHTVANNPANSPGQAAIPTASGSAQFISQAAAVTQHSIRRKSNPADHS